jgi:hypothetical protein
MLTGKVYHSIEEFNPSTDREEESTFNIDQGFLDIFLN